ncbi:Crp/Fnr family transcriptional regulator [Desulfobacter vibrioformis]|uniref:Crp/Fnr family transcriptional regulator n=1 Tax=Desulfobacter vibrioformis TaxID=34031 RepID=UPI00068E62B8|nr:cyclic nucleotide-binding domain-containing protein [Desulfobacter vibrioformis]
MQEKGFTPLATYLKQTTACEPKPVNKPEFSLSQYQKGQTIFTEGEDGYDAYIIKQGTVEISVRDEDKKLVLTQLKRQDVFGEMALILGNHKRSATATAVTDVRLIRIPKSKFDAYMKASPTVITTTLVAIARRVNELTPQTGQSVDGFEAAARILHLMNDHHRSDISLDQTLETLSHVLAIGPKEIDHAIKLMASLNLLEVVNPETPQACIRIIDKDRFLEKALHIRTVIGSFQNPA